MSSGSSDMINNFNNNFKGIKLKTHIKSLILSFIILIMSQSFLKASNLKDSLVNADSIKLLETYSLFSEYYKNKDYISAYPYGWEVIAMDKSKFAKFFYHKMEDTMWYLHDSSNTTPELKQSAQDSIMKFYDMAIEYYPVDKGYFQYRKAFVAETWLNLPADSLIKLYEMAIQTDPEISSYYYNRLGQLYVSNASDENDLKTKALDLYTFLSEREPDNTTWPQILESLVDNIDQLVDLTKKNWDNDPENLGKAWKYASLAIKAGRFEEAIIALEFLISKSPETINYWNQIATAYQKTENLDKAEDAFKKLIQLEPDKKEHYLNLGIVYKDKGQLSAARTQFQKASEVGGGWGRAIFYEGLLYEQSARGCSFDFETKLVYQLAVETYRRARNMDPSLTDAQDRINALGSSVPLKEDYFFRGYKSGTSIPITGSCFGWIGRSITVP